MATAEGKVKQQVKKVLADSKRFGLVFSNMPVPTGYGEPLLDFVGCYRGRFFAIETKAPGKKPTRRQSFCIEAMREAGGAVFVIDGDTSELEAWLEHVRDDATEDGNDGPEASGTGDAERPAGRRDLRARSQAT